ncbi:MAG: hypothetical protein JWO67_4255 [Streptosporangiaceae bacterium]|nr:hypothetical protein [Streptosporangiaceae bacterium]
MKEIHLGPEDNDSAIDARVGDRVIVTLPENATTGYQWAAEPLSNDTLILESEGGSAATSSTPGAGGNTSVFTFRVGKPGDCRIAIKYWRGFEEGDAVFKFRVSIRATSA